MNKRNIERKRIEQISSTISTGDQIQGNELFMVSARDTNSANGYSTKKMGIQALKDYVLSGITGNNENEVIAKSNGGYEMIDTSESGDGTYTSSTISDYTSNTSKNFLWGLKLGTSGVYGVNEPFEKELGKDCAIWIDGFNTEGTEQGETQVFLNGVRLYNLTCLRQGGMVFLYAKAGQTIKI